MKVTKCKGEGQGSCKSCSDNGKWNRTWMCFLYEIEGYEGCYCRNCVNEICNEREAVSDMARYIDADALIRLIEIDASLQPFYSKRDAIGCVKAVPTADVVPKSEVERLTVELEAMRGAANSYKMHYENLAREIFAEIAEKLEGLFDFFRQDDCIRESSAIILAISEIAELKKKYTEGKQ